MSALQKAIDLVDGQSELARRVNVALRELGKERRVKQQNIWYWLNAGSSVPGELAVAFEMAVDGQIKRDEFNPDVFCAPPETTA